MFVTKMTKISISYGQKSACLPLKRTKNDLDFFSIIPLSIFILFCFICLCVILIKILTSPSFHSTIFFRMFTRIHTNNKLKGTMWKTFSPLTHTYTIKSNDLCEYFPWKFSPFPLQCNGTSINFFIYTIILCCGGYTYCTSTSMKIQSRYIR